MQNYLYGLAYVKGGNFLVALLKGESEQKYVSLRTSGATFNGPVVNYANE